PEQGVLSFEVVLSDSIRGFVRIEASRNLAAAEGNASDVLLWVSPLAAPEAASEALAALAGLPGGDPVLELARAAPAGARVKLAVLALSRFAPPGRGAPLIASSLDTRREIVGGQKASLRAQVHVLFVLTVVLGISTLVVWALRTQRRMRRDMRSVADEGLAAGEDIDAQGVERAARFGHTSELFLALAAILLVAYGIYALLTSMRWE
ncbi:MAG: hypothetical protein HYZ27_08670, partial [Deltaproteobacteria bacterium]|nr:hypothetical protein [Deltaproteobacteria bacterium]